MKVNHIRVFIPSKDYAVSKSFYQALGFEMDDATDDLCLFQNGDCVFFLQNYYNQQLAENLNLQLIVDDIDEAFKIIADIECSGIRYEPIKQERWGKVIYLWGPAGELWHVTQLNN